MADHHYLKELREFSRAPRATTAEDYARHRRLLDEALAPPEYHLPTRVIGISEAARLRRLAKERELAAE